MAKEYFTKHNIQYTDHNVASDKEKRQEMLDKTGQLGVPVITIGDSIIIGFDKPAIDEALGLSGDMKTELAN